MPSEIPGGETQTPENAAAAAQPETPPSDNTGAKPKTVAKANVTAEQLDRLEKALETRLARHPADAEVPVSPRDRLESILTRLC
jgi:hypothetical protein